MYSFASFLSRISIVTYETLLFIYQPSLKVIPSRCNVFMSYTALVWPISHRLIYHSPSIRLPACLPTSLQLFLSPCQCNERTIYIPEKSAFAIGGQTKIEVDGGIRKLARDHLSVGVKRTATAVAGKENVWLDKWTQANEDRAVTRKVSCPKQTNKRTFNLQQQNELHYPWREI